MASGKGDKAGLGFLDRAIADLLQNNDFKGIAQLKTALKGFMKDQLVDDNSDYICDAWTDYRVGQKSDAMKPLPTPPPSILPANYSPASEEPLEIDLDNDDDGCHDDDGDNLFEEEFIIREGCASVDQTSGGLTLFIHHTAVENFFPLTAKKHHGAKNYIEQVDAEDLGIQPCDIGACHRLRWYSKGANGQGRKMTTSEFRIVKNNSLPDCNVLIGRDRDTKAKYTSHNERRAPLSSPRPGVSPQEGRIHAPVSPNTAASGSSRKPGREERLHHEIGARFGQVLQAHMDAEDCPAYRRKV